ncbi:MAG: beta-carotene hydroxylase [Pseudomonadota bacterium]
MSWLLIFCIIAVSCVATEALAWFIHRHVMHSWGWRWHKSHHEHHDDTFELNDAFSLIFAGLAIVMLFAGQIGPSWHWLFWVGIGVCVYGFFYVVVHEVLTHQRLPVRWQPKRGYLKRLIDAHHLHHAARKPGQSVSYGFLYAPPVSKLREELHERRVSRKTGAATKVSPQDAS